MQQAVVMLVLTVRATLVFSPTGELQGDRAKVIKKNERK
jgi:hypothetical protein